MKLKSLLLFSILFGSLTAHAQTSCLGMETRIEKTYTFENRANHTVNFVYEGTAYTLDPHQFMKFDHKSYAPNSCKTAHFGSASYLGVTYKLSGGGLTSNDWHYFDDSGLNYVKGIDAQVVKIRNAANSPFKDYYLDIDGHSGKVILNPAPASGTNWMITRDGNSYTIRNMGISPFRNWYLVANPAGRVQLYPSAQTRWQADLRKSEFSLRSSSGYLDIDGNTGDVILSDHKASGTNWLK